MQFLSKFTRSQFLSVPLSRSALPQCYYSNSQRYQPQKPFLVLGIETSCDDTAASVVSSEGRILGDVVSSQAHIHQPYGGIVPRLAARSHEENIDFIVDSAVQSKIRMFDSFPESGKGYKDFHSIAVTTGPGLTPCLRVGLSKARILSREHNLPVISINHLEGHAFAARLKENDRVPFPFVFLLLSGGHSQILLCKGISDFYHLGGTLDDSLGEAYDKVARLLGSEFAHGSYLEQMAQKGNPRKYQLPQLMKKYKNCDFSFAGLKSAVVRLTREIREAQGIPPEVPLSEQTNNDIAAVFQHSAIRHVEEKTKFALKWCQQKMLTPIPHLVVSGGVARNAVVRTRLDALAKEFSMKTIYPELHLCTDNASMIAWAAIELLESGKAFERGLVFPPEEVDDILERARWPLSEEFEPFDSHIYPKQVKLKRFGAI